MSQPILHIPQWSLSSTMTPIELYEFRNTSRLTQPLLFVGGVHGDEPEGVMLATQLLQWLLEFEQQQKQHLMRSWILIPCLNIDGYQRGQRVNAAGVDLNRNFPSQDWTSESTQPRYFPGPQPASEPETQALIQLIEKRRPSHIVHFHSWKPSIVVTGEAGRSLGEVFSKHSGYPLQMDIGYPTPGSLGQYAWHTYQTPVLCIEEREGETSAEQIWQRFKGAFSEILFEKTL